MDEEVPGPPGDPDAGAVDPGALLPSLPPEVSSGDEELRKLIDAGASTPEELRELAARIRAHRELEETLWRNEVRPALIKAKKTRFKIGDVIDRPAAPSDSPSGLVVGLVIIGAVLVLLLAATQSTVLWVLVPVVGILGYAYVQGKKSMPAEPTPPLDGDGSD